MKLDLNDLLPVEAPFELSNGKKYTLKKFSLAVQIWMQQNFGGVDNIEAIFREQKLKEISEIVFYLLKEKGEFRTIEEFQEIICTQKDRVEILTALLKTIGISQPIMEQVTSGEAISLGQQTGAQVTTSLPANTDTPLTNS